MHIKEAITIGLSVAEWGSVSEVKQEGKGILERGNNLSKICCCDQHDTLGRLWEARPGNNGRRDWGDSKKPILDSLIRQAEQPSSMRLMSYKRVLSREWYD